MKNYDHKRELTNISEQWHKIELPNEIFGKTEQDLRDIRIYGLSSNDTIEAPYVTRLDAGRVSRKNVPFKTLNTSHNSKGYYYTFEVPSQEPINHIKLEFKKENFDWQIALEGSQDQQEWFTIVDDYRILSIKNGLTDFQFTKVVFPTSKYRYFRLLVKSGTDPELGVASIQQKEVKEGTFREYAVMGIERNEDDRKKQTEINIDLDMPVRVGHIKLNVADDFDYYRPVCIKYLADSVQTEQGWNYSYRTLASGILNSLEKNKFNFGGTTVKSLKIEIDNHNNQPLGIDGVEVKGHVPELVARFTQEASYFLVYGNENTTTAYYDIERFTKNIPEKLTSLTLGKEVDIEKEGEAKKTPLFKNKNWLWAIMVAVIVLLGWFSLQMIRNKK
nr:DUF3999 family protein [Allomuricauda sp.]